MRQTIYNRVAGVLIAGMALVGPLSAQPAADGFAVSTTRTIDQATGTAVIKAPVSTDFGVYRPYLAPDYTLKVGLTEPSVAADFSNVIVAGTPLNWNGYFTAGERSLLQKNNFVARPEGVANFAQAYAIETSSRTMGSFVTVDAVLHGLRITLDESVRDMERGYTAPALGTQLDEISRTLKDQLTSDKNQGISGDLRRVLAYVETGRALLDPSAEVDSRVETEVTSEIGRIQSASGTGSSMILSTTINYAGFRPTGSYSLNEDLGNYYRAKVWLGEVGFPLRTSGGAADPGNARAAALLARALESLSTSGEFARRYSNIDEPVAFLSGRPADGAHWQVVATALRKYYGRVASGEPGFLADNAGVAGFVGYLEQQIGGASNTSSVTFRLFNWKSGQQAMSSELAELRNASRGSYGLNLMSALGNSTARNSGEDRVVGGRTLLKSLSSKPAELWVQDAGYATLYTVQGMALNHVDSEGYPRFMRSDAWKDREILSALGGWASFQHSPLTMQMRSVAKAGSVAIKSGELGTDGYVEPNPEAWGRVAAFAGYLRNGFTEGRGERLIDQKLEKRLQDIENSSMKLMQIAIYELEGKELKPEHLELIQSMRDRIVAYESSSSKGAKGDQYPIVGGAADLAGATMAGGYPMVIYAIVPRNDGSDGLMLTRGAIFSYYEPEGSESFKTLLTTGSLPAPDKRWTASFISSDRSFTHDPHKFQGISAGLPAKITTATPSKKDRNITVSNAQLELESPVVSSSNGDLWFTVRAPRLEGSEIKVIIATTGGQVVKHMEAGRIRNGERFDMISIKDFPNGQYLIRAEDLLGQTVASGRFTVVR